MAWLSRGYPHSTHRPERTAQGKLPVTFTPGVKGG